MNHLCAALALLFAYLVLAPAPTYALQPSPASHPMSPAHAPATP